MFLRYGNYSHDPGETAVTIQRQGIFSAAGKSEGVRERWDIQGRLQAGSQTTVGIAINGLQLAYNKQGQDISLRFDDGDITRHSMFSSQTRSGTTVTTPPSFPSGPSEYSTFRNYTITVEGTLPNNNAGLLSYGETFNWTGTGGAVFRFLQGVSGAPEQQMTQQRSTAMLVQSGVAVGLYAYPNPPNPIMPTFEHVERRRIVRSLPPNNSGHWRVTWSYTFETLLPIQAFPTGR
jgi:hypothetical protein